MIKHDIRYRTVLNADGMTITATCARCQRGHVKHLTPEAMERITLKNELRTVTGVDHRFDTLPCAPEGGQG